MNFEKLICFALLILALSCSKSDDSDSDTNSKTFYRGMDLSFQSELEDYNIDYKDADGNSVELLDLCLWT